MCCNTQLRPHQDAYAGTMALRIPRWLLAVSAAAGSVLLLSWIAWNMCHPTALQRLPYGVQRLHNGAADLLQQLRYYAKGAAPLPLQPNQHVEATTATRHGSTNSQQHRNTHAGSDGGHSSGCSGAASGGAGRGMGSVGGGGGGGGGGGDGGGGVHTLALSGSGGPAWILHNANGSVAGLAAEVPGYPLQVG